MERQGIIEFVGVGIAILGWDSETFQPDMVPGIHRSWDSPTVGGAKWARVRWTGDYHPAVGALTIARDISYDPEVDSWVECAWNALASAFGNGKE